MNADGQSYEKGRYQCIASGQTRSYVEGVSPNAASFTLWETPLSANHSPMIFRRKSEMTDDSRNTPSSPMNCGKDSLLSTLME